MPHDDLKDYPRALLENMRELAIAEGNAKLLAEIEEALPHSCETGVDHRDRDCRRN